MDTITINSSIDGNVITLNFSSGEEIGISTEGDVDLSEYVKTLTTLIDKKPKLSFTKETCEDSKINLIQETIENINTSFNESVIDEDETISGDAELDDQM